MRKEFVNYFKTKKNFKIIFISIFLFLLFVFFNGFSIYYLKLDNYYFYIIKKIIPYPAIIVGNHYFSLGSYDSYFFLNKTIYDTVYKLDLGKTEEGKRNTQSLRKKTKEDMINGILMENMLKNEKKEVSKKEVNDEYKKTMKGFSNQREINDTLKYIASLDEKDVKKIIYQNILKDKTKASFLFNAKLKIISKKPIDINNKDDWGAAEKEIDGIYEEVKKDASSFEKYYSLDINKKDPLVQNLNKEYYFAEDLPGDIVNKAFALEQGSISEIIKGDTWYYIIKMENHRGEYKGDLNSFLNEKKKNVRIIDFMK